jgi:hypothetical protein
LFTVCDTVFGANLVFSTCDKVIAFEEMADCDVLSDAFGADDVLEAKEIWFVSFVSFDALMEEGITEVTLGGGTVDSDSADLLLVDEGITVGNVAVAVAVGGDGMEAESPVWDIVDIGNSGNNCFSFANREWADEDVADDVSFAKREWADEGAAEEDAAEEDVAEEGKEAECVARGIQGISKLPSKMIGSMVAVMEEFMGLIRRNTGALAWQEINTAPRWNTVLF